MSTKDDIVGYLQEDVIQAGTIDDLSNWADEGRNDGTHYHGMSYEDGIRDTLDYLAGYNESGPHQ